MTLQMTEEAPPAARIVDGVKVYGKGETEVRALDGITAEFATGQLTAIMGPSGSGKSTLLHCLAGLDRLTGGRVLLGDIELGTLDDKAMTLLRREHIGFVFQAFNLVPTLTAGENIVLPLTLGGHRPDPTWFESLVCTLGIEDRLAHRPSELSGGQQQRVATARALVTRPDLLFFRGRAHRQSRLEIGHRTPDSDPCGGRPIQPERGDGDPRRPSRHLCGSGAVPGRRRRGAGAGRPQQRPGPRRHPRPGGLTMWRITLKGVVAHKLRYGLTALAVVLGVAFIGRHPDPH